MRGDGGRAVQARWRGARLYGSGVAGRPPEVRFVILASPRTGSELLVQLLDSHPAIYCASEILQVPPRWPLRLLAGHAVAAARDGAQAFGCKVLLSQLAGHPEVYEGARFLTRLHARGWRIILLERRNLLQQALSYLHAEVSGFHHVETNGRSPIEVDPVELLVVMSTFEGLARWSEDLVAGLDPLRVTYEADLESSECQVTTAARLVGQLGLEPSPMQASLAKGSPSDVWEGIANGPQVASVISQTRFAHHLPAG